MQLGLKRLHRRVRELAMEQRAASARDADRQRLTGGRLVPVDERQPNNVADPIAFRAPRADSLMRRFVLFVRLMSAGMATVAGGPIR